MMLRNLLAYRWLQQGGILILLTFLVIVLGGCRYPVQPLELPPYGVASAIPTSTQTASPTATVTQTLVPTATPTPSVTPTETLTPTPSQTATQTPTDTPTATPTETFTPEPTYTETTIPTATRVPGSILFAAIGDYGSDNGDEADVANLIKSWDPEFIITLGDNNYFVGAADHIDLAIGKHFHNYIYPYLGSFGEGADVNRYFPSIGNHDMMTDGGQPYYDYFTLPGNERYYDYTWGPVHFFVLNDVDDPDGVSANSVQGAWLQAGLAASTSAWNIVYMHYPPYSSSLHGPTTWAQWPFGEWGADVVMSGHDHTYERLEIGGVTYFVDGTGGLGLYNFKDIVEGSQVRYNRDYGAMRIQASENEMLFEFINRSGELIDSYEMVR